MSIHVGLAGLLLASPLLLAAGNRAPFHDDLKDLSPWHTNAPNSAIRQVEQPREASPKGMEWTLPPMEPRIYYLQRAMPTPVDDSFVIRFAVWVPEPTALEVQIATGGEARLYHIRHFPAAGWHQVEVPVAQMSRFADFLPQAFAQPLFLRFWVDGNPGWAGGAVPRGKELRLVFAGISVTSPLEGLPESVNARLRVWPSEVVGTVHPHVYGHFLEHIYNSVEDGLFGELLRNRAFVGPQGFEFGQGVLRQTSLQTDMKTFAGDPSWADYEFSLRARKTEGAEGFLILFRAADERNFYWWNLGGWGNVRHELEVEVNDARRPFGHGVPGRIETGKWYDIRVRVEGDHLQGWLDGQKLLDVRDATHPRGAVGVGTWATAAEFTDFRVTDLAGNPLPVDFSLAASPQAALEPWHAFPPGDVSALELVRAEDSPNTGWAARVDLASRPAAHGLAQDRINLVAGHKYHGTAWLRAQGEVRNVQACLHSAQGVQLDSAVLTPGTEGWTECPFVLAPNQTDTNGALAITAEGRGALLVDMVSLMRDDSLQSGCRADLLEAVKALRPTIIRWPGGCFASTFRWKRTLGTQHERKPFFNNPWGGWESGGFGTDEFIRLCRLVGAEPLIVLNLGSWDSPDNWQEYLQDALDWVEYCNGDVTTPMGSRRAQYGHPEPYNVTHWELDNETWAMTVEGYAQRLISFAQAIKQRWPNVTLYACSFWEGGDPKLIELAGDKFDLISYHLYDDPSAFATAPLNHEAVWSRYAQIIAASRNPRLKLAVTEWNAQSTDWRTGLFAGGLLNVMERVGTVQMASPALFLRRVDAPAWDNAFINHDHARWFPAPNYVVMKLYREHYQPTVVASDTAGTLNAVATLSDDRRTLVLKVVNFGAANAECQIEVDTSFAVVRGSAWVVQAGLEERNTLDEPQRIAPRELALPKVGNRFVHSFPAYSVTVLELRGDEH